MDMHVLQPSDPWASHLSDSVEQYLYDRRAEGLSLASLERSYGFVLHRVFLPWCESNGISAIENLDQAAVTRFAAELMDRPLARGKPLSRHSTRSYVRVVRVFLTWLEKQGENVPAKPRLPRAGKRRRDVLSRDEIDVLERQAVSERDRLIIRVLGDCGLRLGEVTRLRIRDIVQTDNRVYFHVRGKGDRERRVPIPPPLVRRLRPLVESRRDASPADGLFLACRRGAAGNYDALTGEGVSQIITTVAARTRLGKPVHAHLFRHSWMTEMLRRGDEPHPALRDCRGVPAGHRGALRASDRGGRSRRHDRGADGAPQG